MKKFLPISIVIVAMVSVASLLFAQSTTTVLSIVEKMKAASHDFTLTNELNVGQTDIKSGPLTGKLTGGIVTAEEYNRILEMLNEGGDGGASSGIKIASGQNVVGPDAKLNHAIIDLSTYGFDPEGSNPHIIVSENNYNYPAANGNTMDASQCGFTKLSKLQFRTECMASTNDSSDWVQSTFDWLAIQVSGGSGSGTTGGAGGGGIDSIRLVSCNATTTGSYNDIACTAYCDADEVILGGGYDWGGIFSNAGRRSIPVQETVSGVTKYGWKCLINADSCSGGFAISSGCNATCTAVCGKKGGGGGGTGSSGSGNLECTVKEAEANGRAVATCPDGYTRTGGGVWTQYCPGCGVVSAPSGDNGWESSTLPGNTTTNNHAYVVCCKGGGGAGGGISYTQYCYSNATYGTPVCPADVAIGTQGPCKVGYTVQDTLGSWGDCTINTASDSGHYLLPPSGVCGGTGGTHRVGNAYICVKG